MGSCGLAGRALPLPGPVSIEQILRSILESDDPWGTLMRDRFLHPYQLVFMGHGQKREVLLEVRSMRDKGVSELMYAF